MAALAEKGELAVRQLSKYNGHSKDCFSAGMTDRSTGPVPSSNQDATDLMPLGKPAMYFRSWTFSRSVWRCETTLLYQQA